MPHGEASLRVQMPHGGASERVQMTNLRNKKTIIAHKLMYFYRICNSSNRFLIAKTATFSRTVDVPLSVISRSQVETIVQIFAHVGVEPFATFKVRKDRVIDNAPTPGWLPLQMPHREEGEAKPKSRTSIFCL